MGKKIIPFVIILGIVCLFFWQSIFKGLLPIPADSLTGLYHPFRDFYAKEFPRGMPFKNFLITDPVRQQFEWRFSGITLEKSGVLPLWNPYNGLGMPLLANQQSALLYPLNILFFVLPFTLAWSLQIFLTPLLGAFFVYLYARQVKISLVAGLFASVTFAFSGFMIVWLEWNTVAQSFIWLPLILWCIEKLFGCKKNKQRLLFAAVSSLCLLFSLFAGHLQTFFYVGMMSIFYFLLKAINRKNFKSYVLFFTLFLGLFILFSLIQIIPTLQLIALSARNIDIDPSRAGWFVPYQNLLQFIIPDFFGNPTTLNYWGVWNYAELVGYVGIIPLIAAFIGGLFVKRKVIYFFLSIMLFSLLFATQNPIAQIPFIMHIPFFSTSQPTRLISLIDFSLIILAAFGIDYMKKIEKKQLFLVLGIISLIFFGVWGFLLFGNKMFSIITAENLAIAKRNSVLPTVLFLLSSLLLICLVYVKNKKIYLVVIYLLLILSAYDGLRFASKFTPFTSPQLLFPTTKTITFLQQYSGNYRYMTTDDRILPPNVSAYYQLQSLDVYDPLYLQRYGEFIAAMQRGKPSINPPFGFNRIITPHLYTHPFINLLGVKYIVSLDELHEDGLKKVFSEGTTKVYENTHVLRRAFFAQLIIPSNSKQQSIEKLYVQKDNLQKNAIVEDFSSVPDMSPGLVAITQYNASEVVLQTENSGEGFLVLTDTYYPTWHAFIDGQETKIYVTDYMLRGVIVPEGKHKVQFVDKLF